MPDDWSVEENEALIADYLNMLSKQLRGEPYNKTEHRRALRPLLRNRSDGSIERKHQNLSAALIELGQPFITGYKPLPNFQALLLEMMEDRLARSSDFAVTVRAAVEAPGLVPAVDDLLARLEAPPEPAEVSQYEAIRERRRGRSTVINWLEVEARNSSLGRAGEDFVLRFERARLISAGRDSLADRIEHVPLTLGDGEGFDIRSFEENGSDRLIEVKTTAYGKQTPFFLSRNELAVSQQRAISYHLYRLFKFREDPRLYQLKGSLSESCLLHPIQYQAHVK